VDEHARVTADALTDLIGAKIIARAALPPEQAVPMADGRSGALWWDTLQVRDATVLLTTTDGRPAVIAKGAVTYVATLNLEWDSPARPHPGTA
jgi:hypothetical protein